MKSEFEEMFEKEIRKKFQEWKTFLKTNYSYPLIEGEDTAGLIVPVLDTTVQVKVGLEDGNFYCQVDVNHLRKKILSDDIKDKVRCFLDDEDERQIWKYLPEDTSYIDIFELLKNVIQVLLKPSDA